MRLIDADELKKAIAQNRGIDSDTVCDVLDIIDNAPTVDLKDIYQEGHYDGQLEGYTKAINEARPQGECEKCDYYKFSNAVCNGIVDEMVKLGIDNVDDLLKFLRGKEE